MIDDWWRMTDEMMTDDWWLMIDAGDADADANDTTYDQMSRWVDELVLWPPSNNTRNYTRRSIPLSLGRSFLICVLYTFKPIETFK